jgi:hypothetical protein
MATFKSFRRPLRPDRAGIEQGLCGMLVGAITPLTIQARQLRQYVRGSEQECRTMTQSAPLRQRPRRVDQRFAFGHAAGRGRDFTTSADKRLPAISKEVGRVRVDASKRLMTFSAECRNFLDRPG